MRFHRPLRSRFRITPDAAGADHLSAVVLDILQTMHERKR